MKTVRIKNKHNMQSVKLYEAESIEEKVRRIVNECEPIEDGAPIIFQERIDGVKPEFGYRDWETDRKSTRLNSSHSAKSRMPSSA